ncbi:glutathione S-transferase family protein [Candidatus Colwellia aromaticivorans]|uniref:glutathione S-transferase family protein n=1 Tax=Candidatus Colwellia aromaticivorans TaxID=2267621 RepID=UPI000DF1F69D|nr:glutathione S-transferase family protein [Candidatus Colwellia aromaticivorans]
MKLLGSTTSPFVRRLRLYFIQLNVTDFDFVNLDIFGSTDDRKLLTENNPAQKVPALVDEEQCIYDSRVIFRYLSEKYQQPSLSWPQENLLTLIDAANDSLISLLLLKKSGLDTSKDQFFFNLQHERVEKIFSVLAQSVKNGEFEQWHYPAICLYCLLDWTEFRQLYDFNPLVDLVKFHRESANNEGVSKTDPR